MSSKLCTRKNDWECRLNIRKLNKTLVLFLIASELTLLAMLLSPQSASVAIQTEQIQLTARGNSMYPAIAHGDAVTVQLHIDLGTIEKGDIILYGSIAAMAYIPQPDALWIAHRVTSKNQHNGTWYFKTKGDYNAKADPWEVPGYWVTGKVVAIVHATDPPQLAPDSVYEIRTANPQQTPVFSIDPDRTLLMICGAIMGLTFLAFAHPEVKRRMFWLNNRLAYTCHDCRHYQSAAAYTVAIRDGRFGIQRKVNHLRGCCQYYEATIFEGKPTNKCKHHESQDTEQPMTRSN